MADGDDPQEHAQQPGESSPSPGDVPSARPGGISRLDVLVGVWDVAASFPLDPPVTLRGRTTFEWLEGGFFLIQRWSVEHPDAPDGIAVIGAAGADMFTQQYFDSRGVHRVYEMSLTDGGVWKLWREAPGFAQRFTGRLSGVGEGSGATIEGVWEKSADGSLWARDFNMTYRKIGP
jgi:hypothetical protein